MALRINDPEAGRLARELARETGESITQAVIVSLRERLQRLGRAQSSGLADELLDIAARVSRLPVLDGRAPEEVLGYDDPC